MLSLTLSQYEFGSYDFGRSVTFKGYDETGTAFNATGYTGKIKVSDVNGSQIINDLSVTFTTQSTTTGTFAFTSTLRPYSVGYYWLELELTKAGEQISTKPTRIRIRASPNAT